VAARYSAEVEAEVLGWFKQLVSIDIEPGMHKVEKALKNGQSLVKCVAHLLTCTYLPCDFFSIRLGTVV